MKLKFKIQQYQTDAVQNVVKVFNGQPNKGLAEYIVDKGKTYIKENCMKLRLLILMIIQATKMEMLCSAGKSC